MVHNCFNIRGVNIECVCVKLCDCECVFECIIVKRGPGYNNNILKLLYGELIVHKALSDLTMAAAKFHLHHLDQTSDTAMDEFGNINC